MVDFDLLKGRLALIIPIQNKIQALDKEIEGLQDKIDSLASISSPGFSERLGGNPIPRDEIITSLISDQWDLEKEAYKLRMELNELLSMAADCPDFVFEHYVNGSTWKTLELKTGKSRQLMDYEFKKAILS